MPVRRLDFSVKARTDFQAIAAYIAREATPQIAARFVLGMEKQCSRLLLAPGMGAPYPNRPGVRKLNAGSYKIIYRPTETGVLILRVWDGRRGAEARF
jgi:plasmid stabilization system protein ParE